MTTNPAQPTEADLESAEKLMRHLYNVGIWNERRKRLAQAIADERRAMQERCANVASNYRHNHPAATINASIAAAIRSLT